MELAPATNQPVQTTWLHKITTNIKRYSLPYLFLLPAFLLAFSVSIYPMFYGAYVALHRTRYLALVERIGLTHFYQFFSQPDGLNNMKASLIYTFGSLALAIPIGLGFALLLNTHLRGIVIFRTLLLLPWIVSQAVGALLWSWLYSPLYGPINFVLTALGAGRVDFLGTPGLAMGALIVANVWRTFPLAMILLLAALQTVPRELYESSLVDGATPLHAFVHVTFPFIQPTLLVVTILLSVEYINMVTQILFLTAGSPMRTTEVLSLRLFNELFVTWDTGMAAAIGIVIIFFNLAFSALYFKVLRRDSLS